jgi:signal transduction histidine kinase
MTGPTGATPGRPAADDVARIAENAAARERQSQVRHDLRAPLAVIYPLLSLLLDGSAGDLTSQQRDYLEVLERNVARLEALVTGVTDSGWADCSAAPWRPADVDLLEVVGEVVSLRRRDPRGGPAIGVNAGLSPTPRAWADRDDVLQILVGLVRNAATYTPGDGVVTIGIRPGDRGEVVVEVTDTGPGISPAELDHVFEFGYRGELAAQLRAPGLGAGLWICRELATRNGGSLTLASEPGAGLKAILALPATGADACEGRGVGGVEGA